MKSEQISDRLWWVVDVMTGLLLKVFTHEPQPWEIAACRS